MNFEFIISKFPFEREALARLGHFLNEAKAVNSSRSTAFVKLSSHTAASNLLPHWENWFVKGF